MEKKKMILSLNKEIVAKLGSLEMRQVNGGDGEPKTGGTCTVEQTCQYYTCGDTCTCSNISLCC